jgi:formylglycine-generating enzyme required for sulfatase activity
MIFQDASFAPAMVVVRAGTYWMGANPDRRSSSNERPASPRCLVTIPRTLAVSEFAVSHEEFHVYVGMTARQSSGLWSSSPLAKLLRSLSSTGRQAIDSVTWQEAAGYAKWLAAVTGKGYRLLSEAEWEYCCRAGSEADRPPDWGQRMILSNRPSIAAMRFPANAFGLRGMLETGAEWCHDDWHPSYAGAPVDGSARVDSDADRWDAGRPVPKVVRGWLRRRHNRVSDIPMAARDWSHATDRGPCFRVARALTLD